MEIPVEVLIESEAAIQEKLDQASDMTEEMRDYMEACIRVLHNDIATYELDSPSKILVEKVH